MIAISGVFSIGGLYVSFGTMRADIDKHANKIDVMQTEIASADLAEMKALSQRVAKVEGALNGIDKQLDRIERSLEGRR